MKKAMILIAASNYAAPLQALPGTINSARRLAAWARNSAPSKNYEVLELYDDLQPLTIKRLKEEISEFLATRVINRLVVYFAGHGLVRSTADQFWLLPEATHRAIDVNMFRRRLMCQGIRKKHPDLHKGQLTIIADACRSTDAFALEIDGDAVLDPVTAYEKLHQDLFFATSLASQAYQINASATIPHPFCLFSATLCEALEGSVPSVIEHDHHPFSPAIVNNRLTDYLEMEVPRRAAQLNLDMVPDIYPGLIMNHNYYDFFDKDAIPAPGPSRAPASIHATPMAPAFDSWKVIPIEDDALQAATSDKSSFEDSIEEADKVLKRALVLRGRGPLEWWDTFAIIKGSKRIAIPKKSKDSVKYNGDIFLYEPTKDQLNYPIFAKQDLGWLLMPTIDNSTSLSHRDTEGDVLIRRLVYGNSEEERWDPSLSSRSAFSQALPISLSSMFHLADRLRIEKSSIPNNATVAAYLYDFAGDDDNILRTAHYMVDSPQPSPGIPFDLALLSGASLRWRRVGGAYEVLADLPGVDRADEREARIVGDRPGYTFQGFSPQADVKVRGLFPIFRQGWKRLLESSFPSMPTGLTSIAEGLSGNSAVVLSENSMRELSEIFGYEFLDLGEIGRQLPR